MNSKSSIIKDLERILSARYVGDVNQGHMGATLVRLYSCKDGNSFIAKFCPVGALQSALADFHANVHGYAGIRQIGAENLLPAGYRVLQLRGTPVIVMDDLGKNFRSAIGTGSSREHFNWLYDHFVRLVDATVTTCPQCNKNTEVEELWGYLQFYGAKIGRVLIDDSKALRNIFRGPRPVLTSRRIALCIFDFTPDNLFVSADKVQFIDPWRQTTYLGNPAISVGQFVTLARDVYQLRGAGDGAKVLRDLVQQTLPSVLGCSEQTVEQAFALGRGLQFLLSAYVRLAHNKPQASFYTKKALLALTKASSTKEAQ